jgi:phytoene synthase
MSVLSARELDAAAITTPALRAGYAACRALNVEHGRTFYLATLLLPAAKRPYVHALYGFARYADDLVDHIDLTLSATERSARFAEWSERSLTELDWGASSSPIMRAVIDTTRRWQLPHSYVADFLNSMRTDLSVTGYATYEDLAQYMWGSAAVIGLQMLPILGRANESVRWDVLEPYAIELGYAFQLTNFIRDVDEDLRRGRVYLPQDSLDRFGVDRERLARRRVDEPIRNLLAWEIEQARGLYRSAEPGLALVHPTSRDCLQVAFTLYREILDAVEEADYDVFSARVAVALRRRAQVALPGLRRAWLRRHDGRVAPRWSA